MILTDEEKMKGWLKTLVKKHPSYSELEIITMLNYTNKIPLMRIEKRLKDKGKNPKDIAAIELEWVIQARKELAKEKVANGIRYDNEPFVSLKDRRKAKA